MLNPRLLVVLSGLPDADAAMDMALAAIAAAQRPYGLRFAMPLSFADALDAQPLATGALNPGDILFYDDATKLASIPALLTDETHFLLLHGEYGFAPRWDTVIHQRFRKLGNAKALLTATIRGEDSAAQAYLPAAVGFASDGSALLGAGIALVNAVRPVKTMLIDPAFLFGRIGFLHATDPAMETLSIAAYVAGFPLYALDKAPLWPLLQGRLVSTLTKPGPEILPPTVLTRFEQLAGLSYARQTISIRAQHGLFTVEDVYPQRLPLFLALGHYARLLLRRPDPPAPLVVTAFIDQAEALKPPQAYMLRFANLMGLKHLPLTLYAGGEMERFLRSRFPNTLAYPDNSLLPRALLAEGMTPMQLMRRSKLLLLQRTTRAYPSFSHMMWLDIDTLPHPICPDALLDFAPLMDDRVHIAWVDGEPDGSAIVAPKRLLLLLVREVQAATQFTAAAHGSFRESVLLRHLVDKFPDLFTLHPLPKRELLLLTCIDPALRSAPLNQLLAACEKPIRIPPNTPPPKERNPDD